MNVGRINYDEQSLLLCVTRRERESFGELYSLLFSDLYYYAAKLYNNTEIDPADAVQDVFLALWVSDNLNFANLAAIKAYLFIAIQNNFKKYIRHAKHKERFADYFRNELDRFEADIFETEIFSLFQRILEMLPEETAEIFRLFFKGWNIEEIAEELGKSKQTVYNIRSQALAKLRHKLTEHEFKTLLTFLFCMGTLY